MQIRSIADFHGNVANPVKFVMFVSMSYLNPCKITESVAVTTLFVKFLSVKL